MKTIIAGSRSIKDFSLVEKAISQADFVITEVVSGCAYGVDKLGERWARANGIPIHPFPANWAMHGKRAGYLRNVQMAEYADALIAVYDGISKGTAHMINIARDKGLQVFVYNLLVAKAKANQETEPWQTP